jgi:hypothetical protein
MSMESQGGSLVSGRSRRPLREICPSATLSTTNPTWHNLSAKPGLRGERPAINCLSHGTAINLFLHTLIFTSFIVLYILHGLSITERHILVGQTLFPEIILSLPILSALFYVLETSSAFHLATYDPYKVY